MQIILTLREDHIAIGSSRFPDYAAKSRSGSEAFRLIIVEIAPAKTERQPGGGMSSGELWLRHRSRSPRQRWERAQGAHSHL